NNVLDTLHWMQSKGSPVMDRVSQGAGALWQRTHQLDAPAGLGLIDPLYQAAVKQGVNFKLGMRVQDLILNDKGRVIGVTATDKVGNKY
ncbi:MAG TPA: flavocytochrome c, partial [Sutterellaceae bacterium]|nr:flavocytochrome c [Sutterellaceae bacterium]